MKDPEVFKFAQAFESGDTIAERIGRIRLGDGSHIRLYFSPKGLQVILPKGSECVHFVEDIEYRGPEVSL